MVEFISKLFGWAVGLVVLVLIFSAIGNFGKYEGESAEEWHDEYLDASNQVDDYQSALEEANNHIEDVNSQIDDAKLESGSDYDDMEYALDNLETVDTVTDPD